MMIDQPESKPRPDISSKVATSGDPMAVWNDANLLQACLAGDEQAWAVLLERYSRLIYTIPLRFGFSRVVADEIFQEVCLALLEDQESLRDYQRVRAWLVTVTRRACIRRLQQGKKVQFVDLLEYVESAAEGAVEDDLIVLEEEYLVHRALESLPPRCQRLLRALFFESPPRSYEAIAEDIGIPIGSIGPTRARCLERLHQEVTSLERKG
jgi:RNA polymerase sigma factor (sigma-70 family)